MARPARAPAPQPTAPRVRGFAAPRAAAVRVEFDVRTVYDFVISLGDTSGETEDLLPTDREWLASAHARLAAPASSGAGVSPGDLAVVLAGLVVDRPEVRTAAEFVRLVANVPEASVVRTVLAEDLRDPATATVAQRALDGDSAAIDDFVSRHLEDHAPEQRSQVVALFKDPARTVAACRDLLAAWLPIFEPIEDRVRGILERDVALRAEDRRTLTDAELIERTTGGIRWLSEVGVSRVILAPSYFTRPYNYMLGGGDWRMYDYPVSDAALDLLDPLAPPQDVVRLHRALGDETRLRILRLLRDGDLYLTEIAGLLDLSKPTIKHHLALLRAAGLVTLTEQGGMTYYSLRHDRLDLATAELKRFLLG